MEQHANRSSSVRANKPMNLVSDELSSFNLELTQDEDFNLGSTNIQPKGGVISEEASLRHRNNLENKFERCIMLLETKESTANAIVIRVKGTNLHFSPREFDVVNDLNCVSNKDNFVFDDDLSNRIIEEYFNSAKYIQKRELFAAFSEKIWGKDNDEDAVKFANLYFIHTFLLSAVDTIVIPWLYFNLVESNHYSDYPWGSVSFNNIEPTRKEISFFRILKKVVPAGVSHKDDKKKLKQQHKGLDEQTPKRNPPPHFAKKLSVRTPIFMPIQPKYKVASKRKDINRSENKKSIPVQPLDSSSFSSGDEDDFVSKKVFDKFHNENTKFVDDNIGEAHISDSQFSFSDEVLKSINLDFIKFNLGVEDESKNTGGAAEMTVNTSTEDESKDKECDAEKILNPLKHNVDNSKLNQQNQSPVHIHEAVTEERKAEQNLPGSQVTIPDELLPSLNAYANHEKSLIVHPSANEAQQTPMHISRIKRPSRFKESPFTMNFGSASELFYIMGTPGQSWSDEILAVISFNDKCIYVYNSLSSAGHDAAVLAEVEKLDEVIPICLVACKFYEKKGIDIANHPNYKSYDKMDLFDVYVVEDLPQQPSDNLYALILWDYGMKKEKEKAQSDDEAPMRPPREFGITKDIEVHEI
ncbi:hypothetical protein FXO37_10674 [Capsicum annuum]|nr:hypothetical protein FXO37_10674 [Capsicum annuum]